MYGQVNPDTPVKQLFSYFPFLPHIDLGFYNPGMNATDSCCKTWLYIEARPAELHSGFDSFATGRAPV
jgi:hypothetical protein